MIYILTLTWNGLSNLKKLESGLVKNIKVIGNDVKWYIRDNGSIDGTKEWLDKYDKLEVDILYANHNRDNFAKCINSLLEKASPGDNDIVFLLNNDVEFINDTSLCNMVQLLRKPKIGIVGARLLYNNTKILQHAGVIFGKRYGNMPYHFRHKERSDKEAEKNRYFQAVTAACCLIKGKAIKPLDEGFSWAFEDIDLCLRIGEDWDIAYCGKTKIYHEESSSLKKNPVNKMFLGHNVSYFKRKWFGKYDLDHEKYLNNKNYKLIL